MEFKDAIREGDGERVLRCWKYMIPIFSASAWEQKLRLRGSKPPFTIQVHIGAPK